MSDLVVTGEVSNSKLVAVFADQGQARAAANAALSALVLQPAQVKVLASGTPDVGIRLEPEGGGIRRTLVLAHLWLGLAGLVAGGLLFGLLMALDVPFVVASPWAAGLVMLGFGTIAGLLLGGLVSLRPDHDRYIHASREAIAAGRGAVVVHALSATQLTEAARFLEGRGGEVTRTL